MLIKDGCINCKNIQNTEVGLFFCKNCSSTYEVDYSEDSKQELKILNFWKLIFSLTLILGVVLIFITLPKGQSRLYSLIAYILGICFISLYHLSTRKKILNPYNVVLMDKDDFINNLKSTNKKIRMTLLYLSISLSSLISLTIIYKLYIVLFGICILAGLIIYQLLKLRRIKILLVQLCQKIA